MDFLGHLEFSYVMHHESRTEIWLKCHLFPILFGSHELQYAPKVNDCVVLQCDTHHLVGSHQSTDVQML